MYSMQISEEGYGDIATIKNLDGKTFMDLVHRVRFLAEYRQAVRSLNSKKKA